MGSGSVAGPTSWATAPELTATEPMTRDDLIAHHVEALIDLGWRWEGRGLVPTLRARKVPVVNHQLLSTEEINHPTEQKQ